MDDLLRQCEREEEDLRMEIERERVLAGALDGLIQGNPILSSTPNRNMDPVGNSSKPIEVSERTAIFSPPSRRIRENGKDSRTVFTPPFATQISLTHTSF